MTAPPILDPVVTATVTDAVALWGPNCDRQGVLRAITMHPDVATIPRQAAILDTLVGWVAALGPHCQPRDTVIGWTWDTLEPDSTTVRVRHLARLKQHGYFCRDQAAHIIISGVGSSSLHSLIRCLLDCVWALQCGASSWTYLFAAEGRVV